MKPLYYAHRFLEKFAESTPGRICLEPQYEKKFAANRKENLFRGVFDSFGAAQASAPTNKAVGYDNKEAAALYLNRTRQVFPSDYPILLWLAKLLTPTDANILDLGGHIGVSYYAYRNYLHYPAELKWTVHDVPAVMEHGRVLARELDKTRQLSFCDEMGASACPDILMALGSLQYLPDTLVERLAKLGWRPRHLLINLLPVHPQETYWTLQSIGAAYCPYRIFGREQFVSGFEELGYRLADSWENAEKRCAIPFHPQRSLDRYHGFLFSLAE